MPLKVSIKLETRKSKLSKRLKKFKPKINTSKGWLETVSILATC